MRRVVIASSMLAAVAYADESATRVEDQLFFDLRGGTVYTEASIVHRTGSAASPLVYEVDTRALGGWSLGFGLVFQPSDYIELDSGIEVISWTAGTVSTYDSCSGATGGSCMASEPVTYSGAGVRMGPSIKFGLPLRYVQPYVGVGVVGRIENYSATDPRGQMDADHSKVEVGSGIPVIAGIRGYLRRDLHVVLELRRMSRAITADLDENLSVQWDTSTHSLALALQYSPATVRAWTPGRKRALAGTVFGISAAIALTWFVVGELAAQGQEEMTTP